MPGSCLTVIKAATLIDEYDAIPWKLDTRKFAQTYPSEYEKYKQGGYLALLEDPATPADVKKYIREKVNNGHMLLNSVSQRHSTILRIAESVMAHQREFLDRGDVALKPLTMTQVADELGMHETTVGRAIANKYMLTPRGLIAFRHFFSTGGVRSDDGEDISIATIKTRIKALISEEVPAKPLSDQRLAEMLKKEGFNQAP